MKFSRNYQIAMARNFKMSVPIITSRVITSLNALVIMLMIAQLGHDKIAAAALINSIILFFITPIWSCLIAVGIFIGGDYGAERFREIGIFFRQSLWLGLLMAIPIMYLLNHVAFFLVLCKQSQHLALLAQQFFHAFRIGVIPTFWYITILQLFMGVSRQKVATLFSLISLPLLIIFGYLFTFGELDMPRMGIAGIGYAYSLTIIIIDLIAMLYLFTKKEYRKFKLFHFKGLPNFPYVKKIFKLGLPIIGQRVVKLWSFAVVILFVGWLGERSLASLQICFQVNLVAMMVPYGIAYAATIVISQALGRHEFSLIHKIGNVALIFAAIYSVFIAIVYLVVPHYLIGMFLNPQLPHYQQTIHMAESLFAIAGLTNVFEAVRTSMISVLRGLRDTFVPMLTTIFFSGVLSLIVSYIFIHPLHFGVIGVAYGFAVGFCVNTIVLARRYLRLTKYKCLQVDARQQFGV